MIRNILILGCTLALAGAANAEPVSVQISGKSPRQVRAELYKASEQACGSAATSALDVSDDDCVSSTYVKALSQAKRYWRSNLPARIASR